MLKYKASLSLSGLVIPLFSLFLSVLFELSLQLTALIKLSLSLGISLALPTIAIALSIVVVLVAQFNLALSLQLPSFVLSLAIAIDFELTLVLGFLVTLELLINAVAEASLVAYAWFGPSSALGGALSAELGSAWPDGTGGEQDVTAFLFVATSSGGYSKDQIAAIGNMPKPAPPPTPQHPPPPAGAYPPPQAYERGLANLKISAPTGPGGVQATGTVTVDNSVAPGIGAITGIALTAHGSGYTSMPTVEVSDTVSIVGAAVATPIVVTLPNALTIPIGAGLGVTVADVLGSTAVATATATSPIVISIPSTAGLVSLSIPPGDYGLLGLNGTWYARALSGTTAELWADKDFTMPSTGVGVYTGGATLAGNINGGACAKVLTATTVALYADKDFTIPIVGYGTYAGGTVSGGGAGAAALVTMGGGAFNALQSLLDGLSWPTSTGLVGKVYTFKAMLATVFQLMLDLDGNLQARANLLGSIKAGVDFIPPSISASLEFLARCSANLKANLNVSLPNLTASMSASLSAQIDAIASLTARIGFLLGLATADATLEIWEYTGPGSGLGQAVAQGPGAVGWNDHTPPGSSVTAAVFGLTNPVSVAAFNTFFSGAVA